ncbi:MAG: hypothetical protein QNJ40_23475, partial [Xanthomonadales bacterium]|nr:hypothetical protein [Xanthomonadales bacterium]
MAALKRGFCAEVLMRLFVFILLAPGLYAPDLEAVEIKPVENIDSSGLKALFGALGLGYTAFDFNAPSAACLEVWLESTADEWPDQRRSCLCSKAGPQRVMIMVKAENPSLSFKVSHRSIRSGNSGTTGFRDLVLERWGGSGSGRQPPDSLLSFESPSVLWEKHFTHFGEDRTKTGESLVQVFG